ncbi:MAG: ABC transporter permease [Gammaproteobacteria bacterium]|nr:ABC transporter permease [Gammaproteobacteria bacterium]
MLAQIFQISLLNLRNLPQRLGSSSVIVVGIGGVVAVLVAILAMAAGFSATLNRSGAPDRAIVLRGGSSSAELSSTIDNQSRQFVGTLDGVRLSSGELYTVADIPKRATLLPSNVVIRGVEQSAFEIRPEVRIIEGRNFSPGRNELIAGRAASEQFVGIDLGASVELRQSEWEIVGIFEADGSAYESELWTDLAIAQSAFRRFNTISSMRLQLEQPGVTDPLQEAFDNNPSIDLAVTSEEEFFRSQSQFLTTLITGFGYGVALIMAVGAMFAALNTMYAAVSTRTVEIATLRALGFGATPVVVSVLAEAVALALIGGLLGAAVAWFGFNGYTVSTLNQGSFSQVAFDFAVSPDILVTGIVWALSLGLAGGLFPALQAARMPITRALRGD